MERLIVGTGVLIAIERGQPIPRDTLPDDADIAIAAITASQLLVGVELADGKRRAARKASVDAILATFDVLAFDVEVARTARRCSRTPGDQARLAELTTCRSQPPRSRAPHDRRACSRWVAGPSVSRRWRCIERGALPCTVGGAELEVEARAVAFRRDAQAAERA